MSVMKNILDRFAGSLRKNTPNNVAPTIPIPVQTAYAVPIGRVLIAVDKRKRLHAIAIAVKMLGTSRVHPSVYFSPIVQAISSRPAINKNPQAAFLIRLSCSL